MIDFLRDLIEFDPAKMGSPLQASNILLCLENPSQARIGLLRRPLTWLMEELGLKVMEQSSVFMPVFLTYLKDDASSVVRQSIVSGTNFFCSILEEMSLQYHQSGKVERWLDELWRWMVKFKDAICGIALESGPVGTKLLAIKGTRVEIQESLEGTRVVLQLIINYRIRVT